MSLQEILIEFSDNLKPGKADQELFKDILDDVKRILKGSEEYAIAELWKTSEISPHTTLGKNNVLDIIALIHTTASERDLYKLFASYLQSKTNINLAHPGVRLNIREMNIHIIPTKFAAQGTIRIEDRDYPYFSSIVGQGDLFQHSSRILQHWQQNEDLVISESGLLPFEIELLLAHLFQKTRPANIEDAVYMFFEFISTSRLSSQINIFDRHHNILLNHEFKIPKKQVLINAVNDVLDKYTEGISLDTLGISKPI